MVFLCISKAGFLVIIILHLCCLVSSKPQFVGVFCSNRSGLYASNSPYQSNLSLIFSNLTTAANLRGFYNTTAGEGLDKVYALFYCRGDLNSSDCHNCVKTASSRIIDECQTEKEAIIFFEECTLRYANRLIFSLEEEDPNDWSYSDTFVSDKDGFNQILTTATGGPMNQAAFNSSFKGFATGVTKLSVNQTLYSLVQCTPDILGSPCQKCLAAALDNLLYEGKTRMGLFMPSCVVIYSLTPFFKSGNTSVSSPFYPIAESPENAPFSQVSRTKSKSKVPIAVVVAVPVAGLGLVLLLFVLWFCFHQRKARWGFKAGEAQHLKLSSNKLGRTFKYKELELATDKFSSANLLGQGGFGYVHKGVLPNGKEIAVKQLKSGSLQGEREFQAEVETISGIHHRHLVSLVGCCISGDRRLLVYELIPNKTLEFHLHGEGRPPMSWESRLRIALGAAKGLAYLHEDCQPKIIHRDIKAANILLDNEFEVKVADFGLAKFSYDAETHVSTRVMGTFGYLAPEYALSGKLTEKSDVFSYGIVLLELITGRRPLHNAWPFTGVDLIEWSGPLLVQALQSGDCKALIDPRLENYDSSKIAQMITCAALCVRNSARERPKMSQIVRVLEGNMSGEDLMKELASGDMLFQKASDHDFINHFASDSQAHTTSEWSELSTIEHVVSQSNSSTENHDGIQQSKTDNSVH